MAAVLSRGDRPGWMVSSQQPNSKRVREEDMVWGAGQGTRETRDSDQLARVSQRKTPLHWLTFYIFLSPFSFLSLPLLFSIFSVFPLFYFIKIVFAFYPLDRTMPRFRSLKST